MKRESAQLEEYLEHILEAITRIFRYLEDADEIKFLSDELLQDAVIRNLEVIGEASRNIQKHFPEFVDEHQELPLSAAYQMRNALAHGYFQIDYPLVWRTVQTNLPELHQQIKLILDSSAYSEKQ